MGPADDPELLRQAKEIFLSARELPQAAQEAAVVEACGDRVELRRLVGGLLAHAEERLPLESLAVDIREEHQAAVESLLSERHGPRPSGEIGEEIGPYRLIERIGEGGFGVVFLAEQERPVRRRVALKIIRLGMDTREVVARFEAERQALALMDHPNIAKVFDAGTTATGRPYFVMELVPGQPITEFCDTHGLSVRERAKLVQTVCEALHHAHQKGVIHRDIKPGNVLVRMEEGRPIPKVIDFGIAKATNARLTEQTFYTAYRQMIGTPEYMSPEQAGESSDDVDTRTDVYAIGVVLYELLVGVTPFDGQRLRAAAYGEMQRIIREEDPPRPSTRLARLKSSGESASQRPRNSVAPLPATIRGELDWIVMKAIEKTRNRRYESAAAFGADLGRFLSGDAVLAAPPSAIYLATKFVRRHRTLATTVVLVALTLVAGLIATSLALSRALRAEGEERHQRGIAVAAQALEAKLRVDADRERDEAIARSNEANLSAAAAAIALHEPAAARQRLELVLPDRRGWEWRWLDARCDDALVTCKHTARVTHAAFSPDGRSVALRGVDRQMALYELPSGRKIRSFGSGDDLLGQVAFSPDGGEIAAGTQDAEVTIFRVDTGKARLVLPMPLAQYPATILFSADGKRLLCQGTGFDLRCVNASNGEILPAFPTQGILAATSRGIRVVGSLDGATTEVLDDSGRRLAAFDASLGRPILVDDTGTHVVLRSTDPSGACTLRAIDATNGSLLSEFASPAFPHELRRFSPDGILFAATVKDAPARVWDVRTGKLLATLADHAQPVTGLRFSNDASKILTFAADHTVVVRSLPDGRRMATLVGHSESVADAFFLPDGKSVASVSNDRTVRVHEIATGTEVALWTGIERFVAICAQTPDGRYLLSSSDEGKLRLWDLTSGPATVAIRAQGELNTLSVTTSERGDDRIVLSDPRGIVTLFDPRTGRGEPFPRQMRGLTLAPDGRFALAIPDEVPTFLDGRTGETIASFPGAGATHDFSDDGTRVAFRMDREDVAIATTQPFAVVARLKNVGADVHHLRLVGDRLLALSRKAPMEVWDIPSATRIASHATGVTKYPPFLLEISPSGRYAVMGGLMAPLRVIDLSTQVLVEPKVELGSALFGVITVAFSPDGTRVAAASQDQMVRIIRLGEAAPELTLVGHTGPAHGVTFHPTEPRLASGSWDQTIRIWDTVTGRELAVLSGHGAPVHAVRFSSDGARLYSASADATVRVWDTLPKRARDGSTWDPASVLPWNGRSIRTETCP
ncbi:MAG: protein kinase [Phycisphaerae bacterium]|nr:protein kinase [Phycisphaerae bacterium]